MTTLYAHYTATKVKKTLMITPTTRPTDAVMLIDVTGKVNARKVAAMHDAKPWNF